MSDDAQGHQTVARLHAGRRARSADRTETDTSAGRSNRVDGPVKVTGEARFTAEFATRRARPRGARLQHDRQRPHRRHRHRRAEAAPASSRVLTHHNAPRMKAPSLFDVDDWPRAVARQRSADHAGRQVHWNGQPVAVVVAETLEQAEHAASLVRVDYERANRRVFVRRASRRARAVPPTSSAKPPKSRSATPRRRLAAAAVKVDDVYRTPWYNHNAIEPHATIALWDGDSTSPSSTRRSSSTVRKHRSPKSSA